VISAAAALPDELPISIEPAGPGDEAAIVDHWAKGLRFTHGWRALPLVIADHAARAHIRALIAREETRVTVARPALPEAWADTLCGFCVHGGDVLHWIYTRKQWREQHVASRLIASLFYGSPITATHWSPAMSFHSHRWNVTLSPGRIYG